MFVEKSLTGRPNSSKPQARARSCSIFCWASTAVVVTRRASMFWLVLATNICATAIRPVMSTADATRTSTSEKPPSPVVRRRSGANRA